MKTVECRKCGTSLKALRVGQHGEIVPSCPYQENGAHDMPAHNCEENAVPYKSDGALGHGWECGICGRFLQAG